ncbi:helix-turn-helix transcriptional regulator [Rhodococcus aerolatus]
MDKDELGAFLRTRRHRVDPEDVGLVAGPRRRTAGLRREEVAVLAHISTEYYTRLEQGRAPRPSSEVCEGIAVALRLSEAEHDHLHVLAGTAPTRRRRHQREVRGSIVTLIHRIPATAAFVLSAGYEVLAWNPLAAALMEDFGALPVRDRNLARAAFLRDPEQPSLYGTSDGAEFRRGAVQQLRAARARYPHDPDITGLVDELLAGSAEFARLWERHDVQAVPVLTKTFTHPVVGPVTVDCDGVLLPERDQHLVLYSAPPGSPDAAALARLDLR